MFYCEFVTNYFLSSFTGKEHSKNNYLLEFIGVKIYWYESKAKWP